jgi:hypothetical protein
MDAMPMEGHTPNPNEASAAGGYPAAGEQKPATGDTSKLAVAGDAKGDASPTKSAIKRASVNSGGKSGDDGGAKDPQKVRFDMARSTVTAYAPSDSSEEWDPNQDEDAVSSDDERAPKDLAGYLWKKSPSKLIFCKYQKRYFQLRQGKLFWWASDAEFRRGRKSSKGLLDMKNNTTIICDEQGSRFTLRPQNGRWTTGTFTGAAAGREFYMDADGSEHSPEKWAEMFKAHIAYALQVNMY